MDISGYHAPHIQLDHKTTVPREESLKKGLVKNPDIFLVNHEQEVQDGGVLEAKRTGNIIYLSRYHTNLHVLRDFQQELYDVRKVSLGEYSQQQLVLQPLTPLESTEEMDSTSEEARMPRIFKERIISWAENYKLYLVLELADEIRTVEDKEKLRKVYVHDVGGMLKYAFGAENWMRLLDQVRSIVRGVEMDHYEMKFSKIVDYLTKISHTSQPSEQKMYIQDLNRYIIQFARDYVTMTFPYNRSTWKHLQQKVENMNLGKIEKVHLA